MEKNYVWMIETNFFGPWSPEFTRDTRDEARAKMRSLKESSIVTKFRIRKYIREEK